MLLYALTTLGPRDCSRWEHRHKLRRAVPVETLEPCEHCGDFANMSQHNLARTFYAKFNRAYEI